MATQSQFGHTLFLEGFEAGCSAERLKRLHFSRGLSQTSPYDEAWLQRLIMRQPSILPVDQIEPAFSTLIPVCIELPMRCGYLDNLLVTPNGDLALVECKLWRNPEARREVIAQIIDYAKEISGWTYETLQHAVLRAPGFGSEEQPRASLYETVSPTGEIDEVSFHDAVSRNLKRGRFLLLIVGDGIREGVEGMADFLQQHAGFHFTLAFIEIALFEIRGGYIAQPRVLARTTNIERGIERCPHSQRRLRRQPGQPAKAVPWASIGRRPFLENPRRSHSDCQRTRAQGSRSSDCGRRAGAVTNESQELTGR